MASNTRGAMVEWDASYALGLEEVDSHHRALFSMINDLWYAIIDRNSAGAIDAVLTRLDRYAAMHFGAEEALMREMGYPDVDAHREAHRSFTRKLAEERRKHAAGAPADLEMFRFLKGWLVDHILHQDKDYAAFFERKCRPRPWLSRVFSGG